MSADWLDIGALDQISPGGARTLPVQKPCGTSVEIAVFRTSDDRVHALVNRCPHKAGPLSQGIVHGNAVTCPLHNWIISLETGQALGGDTGCVPVIPLRCEGGRIALQRAALLAV